MCILGSISMVRLKPGRPIDRTLLDALVNGQLEPSRDGVSS